MSRVLHITNGDSAVTVLKAAGLEGDFLPWQDLLHDGPVPADLALEPLSGVRADYIAGEGWGDRDEIRSGFRERDAQLQRAGDYGEVVLWFEHDLYDQLQLLQLLDWFQQVAFDPGRLFISCRDEYLGQMEPGRAADLYGLKSPVTEIQLSLAARAWSGFRASSPMPWFSLLSRDTSALPFLHMAVLRHLEQYPSAFNGLNRTERQALEAVASGVHQPAAIFGANQQADGVRFMGDASFWRVLQVLSSGADPLLRTADGTGFRISRQYPYEDGFSEQRLELTTAGHAVLAGEQDWLALHPLDRWLGGVHLEPARMWRWDTARKQLQALAGRPSDR